MKFLVIVVILFALAASETLNASRFNMSSSVTGNDTVKILALAQPADDTLWNSAACRGGKMLLGMTLNAPEAAMICQLITSLWDGTLEKELTTWGYTDYSATLDFPSECHMTGDQGHGLDDALQYLGADSRSSRDSGDNVCYTLQHRDGTTVLRDQHGRLPDVQDQYYNVNGRQYRVSRNKRPNKSILRF